MIPNQHARTRGEVFFPGDDVEVDARREGHGVLEGARGRPLGNAVIVEEAEREGGEDAVGGD